jgi:uncharacterized protein
MPKRTDLNSMKQILASIKPLLTERFAVQRIGVFGSVVRGEATETSDIDILIDYSPVSTFSLFDMIMLEEELSLLFDTKVDIVTLPALKPHIREHVLHEVEFV